MYVQREEVHAVLDRKCRDPNIVARNGPAFLSQEHVDLGIALGCFFDDIQNANGTLAQESSERLLIFEAPGSIPESAVQFTEDYDGNSNGHRPLHHRKNSPVAALKRRIC